MLPPIEGIAVSINGTSLQDAIERAGASYQKKKGQTPTHVALPKGTNPASVELYNLARHAGPGVVIVGRIYVR